MPSAIRDALNAPLFQSLIERMNDGERWVVLDFGPARTETLALFGQFRCRLDIVDLAESLEELNAEHEPLLLRKRVEALLPPRRMESTDLVLCWDLINYLTRPALTAVMEGVATRGRPGMIAHALIYYSSRRMPARPAVFVPVDEQRLVNVASPQREERDAPRYSPEDFARCMPRYTVERARLLRNGMQEFLFQL